MPRQTSETFGTGDQSWLGSTHALYNARSVAPDPALFPAADYAANGGVVPSGTRLGEVTATGLVGPYDSAATDGRNVLAGFLVTDQRAPASSTDKQGGWPLLDHGRINVDRLPGQPSLASMRSANSTGKFVFIKSTGA